MKVGHPAGEQIKTPEVSWKQDKKYQTQENSWKQVIWQDKNPKLMKIPEISEK